MHPRCAAWGKRQEPDNTETQIHLTYRCCAGAQVQSRGERAWETEEGKEDQRKGALIRRHWRWKGDHACSCSCCWHAQPSSPVQFTEFLVTLGLKETKNTPKTLYKVNSRWYVSPLLWPRSTVYPISQWNWGLVSEEGRLSAVPLMLSLRELGPDATSPQRHTWESDCKS